MLITRARQSYEEEHAARVRRYLLLMSIRIPALVLAAVAYMIWHNGWISLAIVGGSIPIPWIAVIGANDRPPLPKNQPRPYAGGGMSMPGTLELPSAVTGSGGHASPGAAEGRARARDDDHAASDRGAGPGEARGDGQPH